jgi:hypothetical protein
MTDKSEVILFLSRDSRYGSERIVCQPLTLRPGDKTPTNPSEWGDEPLSLENLRLSTGVSDYSGEAFSSEIDYRDVYSINARKAARMSKTLAKIAKEVERFEAREHGDMLVAFARAIGAKRMAWNPKADIENNRWFSERTWYYDSIPSAREKYRALIQEAVADWHAKNPDKVAKIAERKAKREAEEKAA